MLIERALVADAATVFVPGGTPHATYVNRLDADLEGEVASAVADGSGPVWISGASKLGKTALYRHVLGRSAAVIHCGRLHGSAALWPQIETTGAGGSGAVVVVDDFRRAARTGAPRRHRRRPRLGVRSRASRPEGSHGARPRATLEHPGPDGDRRDRLRAPRGRRRSPRHP